ncbi:MAG: 4Fe-4S binding protein [Pseudomonadota bacterium]
MGLHRLKSIRVGISISFFVLISFLFLDFRNSVAPSVTGIILYLQFIPSLLKFLATAAAGTAGFIAVAILTVLFGRVYCSTICPLGTLQDGIGFVARKNGKRRRFKWSTPQHVLRYSIFALTVLSLLAGSGFLLNILDPFSSFGRIFFNLVRPFVLVVNNVAAAGLEHFNVHTLYQVRWAVIAPLSAGVAVLTLILMVWLSARHGRLYCNIVCPVGALLGLVSKISLFHIGIDPDRCTGCNLCASVCKAGCIDIREKTVDFSRCVGCYNCFVVCNKQALKFERKLRSILPEAKQDPERRGFMLNSAIWFMGIAGIGEQPLKIIQSRPTTIPIRLTSPVSPPGSVSIDHFTSTCTACHLCVAACPSRVLVPSFLEFGFLGMMQPRMDFSAGHCNYDCTHCLDVCPSGALLPLTSEKKKLTQLGVAKFIKENCVVHTDQTNCGACSEHCPTKAVNMVPYPNPANKPLVIPQVNSDCCIGCGGCEHACPTNPFKAIYVDGNPVHKIAKKPAVKRIDEKIDYNADFPF